MECHLTSEGKNNNDVHLNEGRDYTCAILSILGLKFSANQIYTAHYHKCIPI